MSKQDERRRIIRAYKEATGASEINMHEVAKWAVNMGWPLPTPKSPYEILAHEFAEAAREEMETDPTTGRQYRVYHAVPVTSVTGQQTLFKWINIHEATRPLMEKALQARRQQMIGDAVQLSFDAAFWNSINPNESPIQMSMDFRAEVKQRMGDTLFDQAAPKASPKASRKVLPTKTATSFRRRPSTKNHAEATH